MSTRDTCFDNNVALLMLLQLSDEICEQFLSAHKQLEKDELQLQVADQTVESSLSPLKRIRVSKRGRGPNPYKSHQDAQDEQLNDSNRSRGVSST